MKNKNRKKPVSVLKDWTLWLGWFSCVSILLFVIYLVR